MSQWSPSRRAGAAPLVVEGRAYICILLYSLSGCYIGIWLGILQVIARAAINNFWLLLYWHHWNFLAGILYHFALILTGIGLNSSHFGIWLVFRTIIRLLHRHTCDTLCWTNRVTHCFMKQGNQFSVVCNIIFYLIFQSAEDVIMSTNSCIVTVLSPKAFVSAECAFSALVTHISRSCRSSGP